MDRFFLFLVSLGVFLTVFGVLGVLDVFGWSPLIDMPDDILGVKPYMSSPGFPHGGPGLIAEGWTVYWGCLLAGPLLWIFGLECLGIGETYWDTIILIHVQTVGFFLFTPYLFLLSLGLLDFLITAIKTLIPIWPLVALAAFCYLCYLCYLMEQTLSPLSD